MKEIYKEEWQNSIEKEVITIDRSYFEHLLSCLANQKFIGEKPPNADAISLGKLEYNKIQQENQKIIDKAWRQGMFLLTLPHEKDKLLNDTIDKYSNLWNPRIPEINKMLNLDIEEFPEDENIKFKWCHLVQQEIDMWIRLSVSNAFIDIENEDVKISQVEKVDYDNIVERRGFTPRMISVIKDILKQVGIAENIE